MPKRKISRQRPRRRSEFDAATTAEFEDRLNLRREFWIAVAVPTAITALSGLLAWHDSYVEPLWSGPVSTLLIVLTAAAVLTGCWLFLFREPTRLWIALAILVHFPLILSPGLLAGSISDSALETRGYIVTCEVLRAEEYEWSRGRLDEETSVLHFMDCGDGVYEHRTDLEDRLAVGSTIEATFDSAGLIGPVFRTFEDTGALKSGSIVSGVVLAVGIGIRLLYVWWRVRRSRRRKRERADRARDRRAAKRARTVE